MTLQFPFKARTSIAALAFAAVVMPLPAAADAFVFSTGNPDGRMATATRPESAGKFEIGRTSGPPTFSTPNVPTRVNSPFDVAFQQFSAGRVGSSPGLAAVVLQSTFTANNSVQPGGIHPLPGVFTGGNGPVTGEETLIAVNPTTPFDLPAGHYFFVPQVELSTGDFL
jgi:hypothetical protein